MNRLTKFALLAGVGSAVISTQLVLATIGPPLDDAERALSASSAGHDVPTATVEAALTALAPPPRPTPPPQPPQPTATPRYLPLPNGAVLALPPAAVISVDADPDNDGGPCTSIDATRAVSVGETFSVAVCLQSSERPPINGELNTPTLELAYDPVVAGISGSGDGWLDLDSNPNFGDGQATGGRGWDCNLLDDPRSEPRAGPSPALLVCATLGTADRFLDWGNVMLATMTFQALQAGTAQLSVGERTSLLSGSIESLCSEATAMCTGATVDVHE